MSKRNRKRNPYRLTADEKLTGNLLYARSATSEEVINTVRRMNNISCIKRKKTQNATQRTAEPPALQHIHFALGVKKDVKTQP